MPYPILDPTGTTPTAVKTRAPRAPRRKDLHGATVGLLVNTEQNAAPFLDEIGRLLVQQHGAIGTMARTKVNFAAPAPDDLVKEMTTGCDVIITGVGYYDMVLPGGILIGYHRRIQGALFGGANPLYDIPMILGLWQAGDVKLTELVTRRYTLDQINEGYQDMMDGKNVRGVIMHEH